MGHDNVFIGQRAGYYNVTGSFNMIIGAETKGNVENVNEDYYNTIRMIKKSVDGFIAETKLAIDRLGDIEGDTSDNNSVIGVKAAETFVEGTAVGSNNIFCGSFNGKNLLNANNNTLLGAMIAPLPTSLTSNTLIGALCAANIDNNFGNHNTCIGVMASLNQYNCNHNISIGELSSAHQSNSTNNISIGQNSAFKMTDGHNNINIGTCTGYNSNFDYCIKMIHTYTESTLDDFTLVSNIEFMLESSNVSYVPNVDISNILLKSLTYEPDISFIHNISIASLNEQESNINANVNSTFTQLDIDSISALVFHDIEPQEGNVYLHIPSNQWMNDMYFTNIFDRLDIFPNIDFAVLKIGDIIEPEPTISTLSFIITFMYNEFNSEYLFSTKCIGTTLPSFNIVYDNTLLSGYITISKNIVSNKLFVDDTEKNIQFISTYIS